MERKLTEQEKENLQRRMESSEGELPPELLDIMTGGLYDEVCSVAQLCPRCGAPVYTRVDQNGKKIRFCSGCWNTWPM